MYHIFGDESIKDDVVVYGLVIVPDEMLEIAKTILETVKVKFGGTQSARFHCREVFHNHARSKSDWAHLNSKEPYDLAFEITKSLGDKGLDTCIGLVNRKAIKYDLAGIGSPIQDIKQLIPYAFQGAMGTLFANSKYANNFKLWIEPNSDLIKWYGSNRQVERLLHLNQLNVNDGSFATMIIPENLETKERPSLLELADLLAYCSCRVQVNLKENKNRYSDQVIGAIYKAMNPTIARFNLIDPAKTKVLYNKTQYIEEIKKLGLAD